MAFGSVIQVTKRHRARLFGLTFDRRNRTKTVSQDAVLATLETARQLVRPFDAIGTGSLKHDTLVRMENIAFPCRAGSE